MSLSGKTVLVTGANGFIGRALVAHLRQQPGCTVISSMRHLAAGQAGLAFDLEQPGEVPSLAGIDIVVHCAARVHVMSETASNPEQAFQRANVEGTLGLARAAAKAGVGRFVYLSSVKINGDASPLGQPFTAFSPPAPADFYSVSKWRAEQALRQLAEACAMELVVVRPPLVYGPGAGGNFAQLVRWVKGGVPLPLARVDNRRSLVSLGNLVSLVTCCCSHPAAAGGVFFASDGEAVSTPELLSSVAHGLGKPLRLFYVAPCVLRAIAKLVGKRRWYERLWGTLEIDCSEARQRLGWVPVETFEVGVARAVKDL